ASAMEVATRPGACISDQTIYDNERGDKLNPGLAQLTRHSQALRQYILDLFDEIRREVRMWGQ
ncbi:MAG: hypothetical protein JNJ83_20290, partial [Verrucomicrobiaceae bacterium]|nr:hypothetical protein [Verrucomicrobiaceae bacterium]MBL9117359.1 hypothetical protein [Verrucomicrobiaceae bacterium]